MRSQTVRSIGVVVALLVLSSLAGCSALGLGGGGGGGCGPGETEIGSLDPASSGTASVTGEVMPQPGTSSFSIDDGTGVAYIRGAGTRVEGGDCVTVTGSPGGMVGDSSTIRFDADEVTVE